jgi:hypothetical protein
VLEIPVRSILRICHVVGSDRFGAVSHLALELLVLLFLLLLVFLDLLLGL